MSKKVIRLTEGDIENIVRAVIKEQSRGDLNPRKRKNKDKTDRKSSNWRGGDSGTLNFDVMEQEMTPLAINVTEYNFDVRLSVDLTRTGREIPPTETPPTPPPPITIPQYTIQGSGLPYADNMVMPYFDKYPESNEQFRNIVESFVKYIKAGGGDQLDNITIKGSADSGRPTLKVPSGYSKLDHPDSEPYGGKTDPKEMNQYLADMRAKQYARALISEVEKQTGLVLSIKVLKGDNFYGQGDSKRGQEFRKITLSPNAPTFKPEVEGGEGTAGTKTPGKLVKGGGVPYEVAVYWDGKGRYVEGFRVLDFYNNKRLSVSKEVAEKLDLPTKYLKGKINSEVKGQDFYVNGKLIGPIRPISESPVSFTTMNYNVIGRPRYFAGPITTIEAYRTHKIGDEEITVAYLSENYFTFT